MLDTQPRQIATRQAMPANSMRTQGQCNGQYYCIVTRWHLHTCVSSLLHTDLNAQDVGYT